MNDDYPLVLGKLGFQVLGKMGIQFDEDEPRARLHPVDDAAGVATLAGAELNDRAGLGVIKEFGGFMRQKRRTGYQIANLNRIGQDTFQEKEAHGMWGASEGPSGGLVEHEMTFARNWCVWGGCRRRLFRMERGLSARWLAIAQNSRIFPAGGKGVADRRDIKL